MQPIFNKMITMWKELGVDFPIEEGTYWYEHGIVKGFSDGEIYNLYKINIKDDLTISGKLHKDYKKNKDKIYETWEETIARMDDRLNEMESSSISLLKEYGANTDRLIIDTNSTGKDSEVKTYLARKAGLDFKVYFNVTTMDVGESNRMAKEKGYEFTFPDKGHRSFYDWQKKENLVPSRLNRSCCLYFKEGATINAFDDDEKILFLFGMRNDESTNRSGYTDIWVNHKWGDKRDWLGLLPIREWNDLDIWLYTLREEIKINEKYKMGYSRVGCGIVCPNYTKATWLLDKYWYPKMFARWRKILEDDFIKNSKWLIMNCTLEEYVQKAWNGGTFRAEPTEEVAKEYSIHSGLDYEVAEKYFSKRCANGCINNRSKDKSVIKIKDKEVLAMNMKLYGRSINLFKCKKCLLKELDWTVEEWNNQVKRFKDSGCQLF